MASKIPNDDKENTKLEVEEAVTTAMNPPPQPSSQRSASKDLRDCPQTPVGRLPLSELLANSDDARHYQDVTPIERVLWDNSPLSLTTPSSISKEKKRKRAHSSSPASSSQNQSSKHFSNGKAGGDASALPTALKTPKADLVDDLWNRYSLPKTDRRSPTAPCNSKFPQLIQSSSPAAEALGRDGAGLRRAFSCIDWPTSAAKRRKLRIDSNHQAGEVTDFAKFDKPIDSVQKTRSRVSLLVERIHNHLAKPIQRRNSSSSDLAFSPATSNPNSPAKDALVNPFSQVQVENVAAALSQAAMDEPGPVMPPLTLQAEETAESDRTEKSSDFNDDDLDIGMVEALNGIVEGKRIEIRKELRPEDSSSQTLRALNPEHKDAGFAGLSKSKPVSMTSMKHSTERSPHKSTATASTQHHDEFGNDEEEVTVAELEGLLAIYDTQPSHCVVPNTGSGGREKGLSIKEEVLNDAHGTSHKKQPVVVEMLSDDDEFGGDSDFEQIAAEIAASQIQQEEVHAKASVCSSCCKASA